MNKSIREQVKQKRIKMGLTQKELGKKIGVGDSQISRVESGKVNLGWKPLLKAKKLLKLKI